MSNREPEKFCRFLKNGLVFNNNITHFTVSPCCYFSKNYSIDPVRDVRQQLTQYREQWNQENFSETCKICLDLDQAGKVSYRQASFDITSDSETNVSTLTVAVNKQCNLACASCGPESSSFWFQENKRNNLDQPQQIIDLHREDRTGDIAKNFLKVFESIDLRHIQYIKFGGGEPLMSDTHTKILSMIPDPSRVVVQYTSNFSIEPSSDVFDLWERFRLVKWCASIDGIGDQFELLRWPYKWQNLEKFIQRMIEQVPHNVMFGVEHTLNPLNIWYFDRFQKWFENSFSCNRYGDRSDLNIHACAGNLDLSQTPPALRSAILDRFGPTDPISILLQNHPHQGSYKRLAHWLDTLDRHRHTKWRRTFAEIEHFFQ